MKRVRRWSKGSVTLSCLCLSACLLHGQTPAAPATAAMEREFQDAMTAEDKGDLARAESLLLDLHKKQAGIFAVDESLGLLYVAGEKFAKALPLLEAAARESDRSDVAHANLGATYFKLHRNLEALREFERAAQLNPRNAATQQSLGELLLAEGKSSRAAEAYSAALEIRPDDPDLKLAYATALIAAGELDKARNLLAGLPKADEIAAAQTLVAEIDEKKGDYQQAVVHFTRAAEIDQSEENVWALGVEFLRHWTFEAAIREFEFAAERFPASTRMKLGLGAAYFGGARYGRAIPVFADLLSADKDNSLYAELLGMACTAVNDPAQKRCDSLVTYAESHPKDARANTYAASMLLMETATDAGNSRARRLLTNALAVDPKMAEAHYRMGVLEQNQGAWAASIPSLERSVAIKPDFAQAHYRLALAYWRAGHKEKGQAEMELEKKYAQQEAQDLNKRLRQITTFIVDGQN
jgi:tetratricopeptide (TPR) repeat protein